MPRSSVNVAFTSTGSFTPAAPQQKMVIINTTNRNFPRSYTITQDAFTLTFATSSVAIPITQLIAACVSGSPALTWAPIILTQPTSSVVTHPTASYFVVSGSSELPITYQWYYQSGSANWTTASDSRYTGSTSPALTSSFTDTAQQNTASYFCYLTNAAGSTSSSIAILQTL